MKNYTQLLVLLFTLLSTQEVILTGTFLRKIAFPSQ